MQIRKTIKTRGHFPNDEAALRLIWLAIHEQSPPGRPVTTGRTRWQSYESTSETASPTTA
jgi:transposase-like protein